VHCRPCCRLFVDDLQNKRRGEQGGPIVLDNAVQYSTGRSLRDQQFGKLVISSKEPPPGQGEIFPDDARERTLRTSRQGFTMTCFGGYVSGLTPFTWIGAGEMQRSRAWICVQQHRDRPPFEVSDHVESPGSQRISYCHAMIFVPHHDEQSSILSKAVGPSRR